MIASAVAIAACADVLGIDDGIPRDYDAAIVDASLPDAKVPDVTTPDAPVDAGIDVPMSPLVCGSSTCNALVEGCCRMGSVSQADAETFACAQSCDGGLFITCDESANCAALGKPIECCAITPDGGTNATSTACVAPGTCSGAVMCRPGDDELCDFDAGEMCLPSVATILGYSICKT